MNCRKFQPRLSDYLDSKLSARATWEVDLHLAECHECTRLLNEMRRTVDLMADAPRFEVSPDFMQNLQRRIGEMEPSAPRLAWVEAVLAAFRPRILPAWGAALATCALAAILFTPHPPVSDGPPRVAAQSSQEMRQATRASVALSATDPFADLGVANLAAHASDRPVSEIQ